MIKITVDGASKGNPGDAGIGLIVMDGSKNIHQKSVYVGVKTCNEAEYLAIIYALKYCVLNQINNVTILSDSQLVVNQLKGKFKIKNYKLIPLFNEAVNLMSNLNEVNLIFEPREKHHSVDILASNAALSKCSIG